MSVKKQLLGILLLLTIIPLSSAIIINEFTVDPQTDWDESGSPTSSDEWIELYNPSNDTIDLSNWTLVINDSSPDLETLSGIINPLSYKVILNPSGQITNDGQLALYDNTNTLIDSVSYGNWQDGNTTDNAPDGNAASEEDECLARIPNGQDTNIDATDFTKTACTYNRENRIISSDQQGLGVTIAGKVVMKILPRFLDFGLVQPGSVNNTALNGPIIFNATGSETNVNIEIMNVTGFPFNGGLKIDDNPAVEFFKTIFLIDPVQTANPTLDVPEEADQGQSQGTITYMITGQAL